MSDSSLPYGLQPTRLLRPWDFPGESTGVGCHCLLNVSSKRLISNMGFPGSSAGKESAYSAGDPGSIPGLGRSPGERIDYPLQCLWASALL